MLSLLELINTTVEFLRRQRVTDTLFFRAPPVVLNADRSAATTT